MGPNLTRIPREEADEEKKKKQMNSEEPEEVRKTPLQKLINIEIDGGPACTNPLPGKYFRKDMKGRSQNLNEIGYTKLRSTANERTDWVLRWVLGFLKGIRTLEIGYEGVEIAGRRREG